MTNNNKSNTPIKAVPVKVKMNTHTPTATVFFLLFLAIIVSVVYFGAIAGSIRLMFWLDQELIQGVSQRLIDIASGK